MSKYIANRRNTAVVDNTLLEYDIDVRNAPNNSLIINDLIAEACGNVPRLYSYIVRAVYKKGKFSHWSVHFMVSQTDRYNQIFADDAAIDIMNTILRQSNEDETNVIIGYRQGSLETLVELYEPLVKKLAMEQHRHWQDLEVDDLQQICRMCICTLYNGGYYIHKRLICRAFYNEVLMIQRKKLSQYPIIDGKREAPVVMSLDAVISDSEGPDEIITVQDMIADPRLTDDEVMEECEQEEQEDLLGYYKELLIEEMGARTYDAVLTEYNSGKPSKWAVTQVYNAKKRINGGK